MEHKKGPPTDIESPATKQLIRALILDFIKRGNNNYIKEIEKYYPEILLYVQQRYPANTKAESLYYYINKITQPPTCKHCNTNYCKFISYFKGYQQYCGRKCRDASSLVVERRQQTNLKKYNSANYLASVVGKQKTKQTIKQKYNTDHYSQTNEFKRKFIATMKAKYGVTYAMQSSQLKEQHQKSLSKNHGVTHPSQSKQIYKKRNARMKAKYGVEHAMQSEMLKEKHRQTLKRNYNVEVPLQSKKIQKKMRQTMVKLYGKAYTAQVNFLFKKMKETNLQKYGVEYPLQNGEIQQKAIETNLQKYGVEYPLQNRMIQKQKRDNMEALGKWIPLDLLTDFELYYKRVWWFTNKQPLGQLNLFEKRGLAGVEGAYHVDHKVSIKYGFENNIPPYIIGNIHNLEMLPWKDNIYKSNNCSIPIEQLFDLVFNDVNTIGKLQPDRLN